jgi:uncharacterized OB-fold protein
VLPLEKIDHLTKPHNWHGDIPIYSIYTLGVAGERFFRELRDSGRLMGTRCANCDLIYAPPRLYCERCLADLSDCWQEVSGQGRVHTYTAAYYDLSGTPLKKPEILALVQLEGTHGGIIHRLEGIDAESVSIGLRVGVRLKPASQRKGSITDIRCFRPVKTARTS